MNTVFVLIGLAFLIIGGELLVRGAVVAATKWGVSPLVIGLTLVGFGTSTPELVTSLQAAFSGAPEIAIGNIVGSNIGNVLLILGLTACLGAISVDPHAFKRDGVVLAAATIAMTGTALTGTISRLAGVAFLSALSAYLVFAVWSDRPRLRVDHPGFDDDAPLRSAPRQPVAVSLFLAFGGLILTVFGARFLVSGAVGLAQSAGVSETLIGLTVVAIGTSLPELVTSIMAIMRKEGDVAFGNIVGSNIFNTLGILGATAAARPLTVPSEIVRLDLWVAFGAVAALILFARTGWRIGRREGAVLLMGYLVYISALTSNIAR